jgi:hypothetical protein
MRQILSEKTEKIPKRKHSPLIPEIPDDIDELDTIPRG